MDITHWFLINMFLDFCFSRCIQTQVHWCCFHAARGESGWCIGLWCLAAQTVAAIHLASCWWLLLSSAPHVHKSIELLWHKTPDFTPDMRPHNRPDLNPVDYRIWTVIQKCIYQKQQLSSYITDKMVINRMAYYISQGRVETFIRRGGQFCCSFIANLLQYLCTNSYQNTMPFDRVIAKIEGCNFFASHV